MIKVFSQNSCSSDLPKRCIPFGSPFGISQQSKSTTLQPGQKALCHIAVYKDFVYRISLCSKNNMEGLYFRILNTKATNNVLFDSSKSGVDKLEKIFEIDYSCNLIIEVVYPNQELKTKRNKSDQACVDVLIEYYKKVKL